ncbi:hypothetical protein LUZ60_017522 [Juncus effusus]|nr:hypothetical protein LUZ60_017522 [Juncus effusus]
MHCDYTLELPDECLALIFNSLTQSDRNRCSLVCHRWYRVEGQSRHRLSLHATSSIAAILPTLLTRFDSVIKLALKTDRRCDSISDESLTLISSKLQRLTRLKLRSCRQLTERGISNLASNCTFLKKISCASITFGPNSLACILSSCPLIEDISLKRLKGLNPEPQEKWKNGFSGSSSLKSICMKDLYNAQCFVPYISACKNLRTVKVLRCSGMWDGAMEDLSSKVPSIIEFHLEKLQVGDKGLFAISKCSKLEILHIVKTPECSDAGIAEISSKCHLLRKLHIDGWRTNRIGDLGLIQVSLGCPNLQELVLIGINPTVRSIDQIGAGCRNLERLAMCGCESVGDKEMASLGKRCKKLRKLCVKGCPVGDEGIVALAQGAPSLVKVKLKRCGRVSVECVELFKMMRGEGVSISLDTMEVQNEQMNVSQLIDEMEAVELPSSSTNSEAEPSSQQQQQPPKPSSRMRALMVLAIRRISGGNGSDNSPPPPPPPAPPAAQT